MQTSTHQDRLEKTEPCEGKHLGKSPGLKPHTQGITGHSLYHPIPTQSHSGKQTNKLPTITLAQARLPRYISEKSRRMRAFSHGLARFVRLFSTVTTANVQRQGRCRQLQHRLSLVHSKGGSEHRKTGNVLSLQINRTVPSCFIICLL